jgi:di/tricarboxylate transporter
MLSFLSALLICILLLSVLKPNLNAGIPAFVLALLFAPLQGTGTAGSVAGLFPSSLFLTLLGVTLFFSILRNTGFIDCVLERVLSLTRHSPQLVPVSLFLIVAAMTAAGFGNIATIALIAPIALPLAVRLGISPFLITVLIVGAANAASFSPLTLPGVYLNNFIENSSSLSQKMNPPTMRWLVFCFVFLIISLSTAFSFLLFGGRHRRGRHVQIPEYFSENELKFKRELNSGSENRSIKKTASITAALFAIFIAGNIAGFDYWTGRVPALPLNLIRRAADVGFIGWLGSASLLLTQSEQNEKVLKDVPWSTIILVCGMSTYIELLGRMGLPQVISSLVQKNIPEQFIPSGFAAGSALLSAFSSSVGVALPVFMPIADVLSKSADPELAQTLVVSVASGTHLVDASPLSTLGALCIAQIKTAAEQQSTYRRLLIYSFCMIPVAAIWAFFIRLAFGSLL